MGYFKIVTKSEIAENDWAHIALVLTENTSKIYINGELDSNGTFIQRNSEDPSYIQYDDIKVFNRTLKYTDISHDIKQKNANVIMKYNKNQTSKQF